MDNEDQIKNENRLTTLEINQRKILDTLVKVDEKQEEMSKDISDIKMTFAKAGGILIGFTMIAAAVGWMLNTIKQSLGLMGN